MQLKTIIAGLALTAVGLTAQAQQQPNFYQHAPKVGYRGFVEAKADYVLNSTHAVFLGATTTHGYQVNPGFFVGAGVGFLQNTKKYDIAVADRLIPIFGELRYDYTTGKKASPYLLTRLGISSIEASDPYYYAFQGGCRFVLNPRLALNVGLSYNRYAGEFDVTLPVKVGNQIHDVKGKAALEGGTLALTVGLDF